MYGLAEYFLKHGSQVSGSDVIDSEILSELRNQGADIFIGHTPNNIKDDVDMVVYTAAVKDDNEEYSEAKKKNIKTIKRAEALGMVVNDKFLIAVSGTHGKTTTTAMIGKVLIDAGLEPIVFVGGNVPMFNGSAVHIGGGNIAVVEADEYDKSFLQLTPDMIVVNNIDLDHMDIYKDLKDIVNTFGEFCSLSKKDAKIIYNGDDVNVRQAIGAVNREKISFGMDEKNYLKVSKINYNDSVLNFSIKNSVASYDNISLGLPGKHNVMNSTACFAVSKLVGIKFEDYKKSISEFKTVDRRLQLKLMNKRIKVYDDYAHHPVEISMSLQALRDSNPNKKIISVFQPHLYSRTKDLYKEFADALVNADEVILLDIYPAREKPIEGVTSQLILNEMNTENPKVKYIHDKISLMSELKKHENENAVIVFQGAGNITKLCDEFINYIT